MAASTYVFLLVLGLALMGGNHASKVSKAPPKIVYKYLPRPLDDNLRGQETPTAIFKDMFAKEDVLR